METLWKGIRANPWFEGLLKSWKRKWKLELIEGNNPNPDKPELKIED